MVGVIANTLSIIIGASIGVLAHKIIPASWNEIILKGLGLCTIYVGIRGSFDGENSLVLIISIVVGAMIGEGIRIEQRFNSLAKKIEARLDRKGGKSNFAQGFITASLMTCVGALVIVGPLNAGLKGDNTLLFTKTAIDGVGLMMFAASLGVGVIFSAISVFIVEGSIFLLAGMAAPVLTTGVINEISCVGSVIIIAMGMNLTIDSKLKIMNYMPAVFMPIVVCPLYDWVVGLM
ncbi:putative membrane protein YqgA involved in biofilm formation [Clostridiales Family XIII bacterium PM5-7]